MRGAVSVVLAGQTLYHLTVRALTFLVVDDNDLQRRIAETYLWKAGHQAIFAASADEVEAVLSEMDASVVVVSAALAHDDASKVVARVRRPRRDPDTFAILPPPPVVIGAGPGEREMAEQLVAAGAAGIVTRPYDGERLIAKLELFSVGAAPSNILVVDDSKVARRAAVPVLVSEGHSVIEAGDGREALALLREHPEIELVISDVVMPNLDGFGLCQAIRARPGGDQLPIILLTSLEEVAAQSRAVEAGADEFLTKPISAAELRLRVRTTLRLKSLQRKLERRNGELEQALEMRERLSRMLVHDFRDPLTRVLVAADMVVEECREAGLDDSAGLAEEIINGATLLSGLAEDLLEVARLEDGVAMPKRARIDVADLLAALVNDMKRSAATSEVELRSRVPAGVVAHADRKWLYRIVQNLISNAVEYSPRGGEVVLTAFLSAGGGGDVTVRVTDDGPGVPEAQRERIFQQFAQMDKKSRRGVGLGLTFCRLAVEAHGGQISVGSRADGGAGAVFSFTLPAPS